MSIIAFARQQETRVAYLIPQPTFYFIEPEISNAPVFIYPALSEPFKF